MGDPFPEVTLPTITGEHRGELCRTTPARFGGKWLLVLYWSPDFDRPEGIREMSRYAIEGHESVQVLGVGMSPAPDAGTLPFPVLGDLRRDLARGLGLPWGRDLRASFLVDPDGLIQWTSIESAARPLGASLRTLDAAPWPRARVGDRTLECMCAWCRQVQSPDGRWQSVESFIESRLPMEFTHGICPACLDEQEQPSHVDRPGPELRRSERVLLTAAVTLRSATLEHPAETLVVSRHGALLSSPVTHPEGATLSLTHVDSGASVLCRVVWSGVDECPGQHKIGIELIEERAEFWGAEYEAKLSEG